MTPFAPALLDPTRATPRGLVDAEGRPAQRRFAVYRNNVVSSLIDALATGFPVVGKLVGAEFFRALAAVFVRQNPPTSPRLVFYGDALPGFLETFEPVTHLRYLADVARLEFALREAYHAADAVPVAPDVLNHPRLMEACIRLAPATRLLSSPYPIHAIWRANTEADAPPAQGGPQTVLVTRPDWDPWPRAVPDGTGRFIAALLDGQSFAAALEASGDALDLAAALTLLLETRSITALEVPS